MEMGEVCELRFLQSLTFRQQGNRPNFLRNSYFSDWHVVECIYLDSLLYAWVHTLCSDQTETLQSFEHLPCCAAHSYSCCSLQDPLCALTEQSLKPWPLMDPPCALTEQSLKPWPKGCAFVHLTQEIFVPQELTELGVRTEPICLWINSL